MTVLLLKGIVCGDFSNLFMTSGQNVINNDSVQRKPDNLAETPWFPSRLYNGYY